MSIFIGLVLLLGVVTFIRDNNVHYIWKGFLAGWPILVLLALGSFFVWQGKGLPRHRNHTYGPSHGANWGGKVGDPLQDARDKAKKAGLDIHIPDVEDVFRR